MDIKSLKEHILQNNIPNVLIFIGDEQALIAQYIKTISSTLGKYYKYYDTADSVLYETTTNLKNDYLYIILNDYSILKNTNYIQELKNTNRNIIIYFTDFDTKQQFYKDFKNDITIFNKLDKYTIVAYLQKLLNDNKLELATDKLIELVEYCDCNLGICLNELDKIITIGQNKCDLLTDYILNNGFPDYRKLNIFSFVQKILNKDLTLFNDLQKLNESTITIMSLLYNQAKNRLDKTNDLRYANIMQLISKLDKNIKDGKISDEYALDYLILEVV